jgi:hypothetical protein
MEKVLIKNGSVPLPCLLFFLTQHPSPHLDQAPLDFSRKLFINERFGVAEGGGEPVRPPPPHNAMTLGLYMPGLGSQGGDAKMLDWRPLPDCPTTPPPPLST